MVATAYAGKERGPRNRFRWPPVPGCGQPTTGWEGVDGNVYNVNGDHSCCCYCCVRRMRTGNAKHTGWRGLTHGRRLDAPGGEGKTTAVVVVRVRMCDRMTSRARAWVRCVRRANNAVERAAVTATVVFVVTAWLLRWRLKILWFFSPPFYPKFTTGQVVALDRPRLGHFEKKNLARDCPGQSRSYKRFRSVYFVNFMDAICFYRPDTLFMTFFFWRKSMCANF